MRTRLRRDARNSAIHTGSVTSIGGTIATMASATAACLFLAATPDLLALARGGADKGSAEAIAWTLGTALGLKYVAARA